VETDAIVIGSGPNGLVAANLLADAGWSVLVVEAAQQPGGGVRSGRYVDPDFISDACSAFYPLAIASPAMQAMQLERYGVRWRHADFAFAHPLPDGRALAVSRDVTETAALLDDVAPGSGAGWMELAALWKRAAPALMDALCTPFPPVRAGVRLARALYRSGLGRFARMALLPVRRFAEEWVREPTGLLFAGNALHADFAPESTMSGLYGWLLAMLAGDVGFPVPQGGAQRVTDALLARLRDRDGELLCGRRVTGILIRSGRAVGVRLADGDEIAARRAVLAAVPAPSLYGELIPPEHVPENVRRDLRNFQWDFGTVKIDWALHEPIPWTNDLVRRAGTVHIGASMDDLTRYAADLAMGLVPARPFVVLGQLSTVDPSRSPAGTESLWGYTHIPQQIRGDAGPDGISGAWTETEIEAFVRRIEDHIERYAPGFRECIKTRVVRGPAAMDADHPGLHNGAFGQGTAALHQQLIFRPLPGVARPETPIPGLYLASSSAHPGPGVHGACGANAARAALRADHLATRIFGAPLRRVCERVIRGPEHPASQRPVLDSPDRPPKRLS